MVLRQGLAALFATLLISFACAAAEAPSIGADPLPLAKPEDVGMSSERLAGIGAALRRISIAASHRAAPSQSPDAPPTSASALDSRSSRHWHHSDDGIGGVVLVAGREGYQLVADPKEDLAVIYLSAAPGPIRWYYRQKINALVYQAIVD